jgi:hypothetical protein
MNAWCFGTLGKGVGVGIGIGMYINDEIYVMSMPIYNILKPLLSTDSFSLNLLSAYIWY